MAKSKCRVTYEFHPLSAHYELLDGNAADELKASLAAIGCQNPAVIYEDQILDGRNRWTLCEELGIECPTIEYQGDEPELFVEAMNGHRRHLTDNAKLLAAVALAKSRQTRLVASEAGIEATGSERNICAHTPLSELDQKRIAEEQNVGERTVTTAAKVVSDGTPEVIEAARDGDLSMSAAGRIASLPKSKQADALLKEKLHKDVIAAWDAGEITRAQAKQWSEMRPMLQVDELKSIRAKAEKKAAAKDKPKQKIHRADAPVHIERLADATGADVPDELLPVFESLPRFSELGLALRNVIGKYEALLAEPAGHYLTKADLATLRDIVERIAEAWPYAVNPKNKCGFSSVGSREE